MSKKKAPKAKKDVHEQIGVFKVKFVRYRMVIFVAFVALVYGYVFWQINNFNNAQPDPLAVSSQTSKETQLPHIDSKTVNKIQQLRDNSVNVQALFDKNRNNPFN